MLYAKSNPQESIKEHTDKLLKNLEILRDKYKDKICENIEEIQDIERLFELLKIVCQYHDYGKVYTPFQNIILEKIGYPQINTSFNYNNVKHEQLSPMFIPTKELNLSKDEKKLVYQAVYYHHERINQDIDNELVSEIILKDIEPRIVEISKELDTQLKDEMTPFYLKYVGSANRIKENDKLYISYCLLKGLLHRLDHCSSADVQVEDITEENIADYTNKFMNSSNFRKNDLQLFCEKNHNENIIVIGSTGMGKTESALLWSGNDKVFFTLPIRISINAIYERIKNLIGYNHVGLLHGTAMDYLEEKQEFQIAYNVYQQSKNLYSKITTCTIDQIFTFVFKYKGYEKMYATLSYSKIIIDEIQAYSPEIVAVILKGLEMINNIGGKFMIMTATLPRIYKEELEKKGIKFEYNEFLKDTCRHRIKIEEKELIEDVNEIIKKSRTNKVLIIVNTINKAIELYKKIQEEGEDNIGLLHSRFILEDRSIKEEQIKNFSKNRKEKGIWITTQIVEASLDIDFDYLYTEMSTLDSLFQRLGRCYRSREYFEIEPNVHIYNKNISGIKYVYDEEINKKSVELLKPYDGMILKENEKVSLVDKLYSKETLKDTEFLKQFENATKAIENIIDYDVDKKDAQKILRNIENITVIPQSILDNNLDLFKEYEQCKEYSKKSEMKRRINKFFTTISMSQANRVKKYISKCPYDEDIYSINLKYDKNIGLILEKDEEYELNERFC